jgi:branched-subunit amino acid permease
LMCFPRALVTIEIIIAIGRHHNNITMLKFFSSCFFVVIIALELLPAAAIGDEE